MKATVIWLDPVNEYEWVFWRRSQFRRSEVMAMAFDDDDVAVTATVMTTADVLDVCRRMDGSCSCSSGYKPQG